MINAIRVLLVSVAMRLQPAVAGFNVNVPSATAFPRYASRTTDVLRACERYYLVSQISTQSDVVVVAALCRCCCSLGGRVYRR